MTVPKQQLPNLADRDWLKSPALRSVFLLLGGSAEVRVVGGAVRDSLLGVAVGDIDLATIHNAEEIMIRAEHAGIKAVATGGGHGTVSLIVSEGDKHHVYEVTPLRVDVETDGRRAIVARTQNWAQDAHRRDFSINALYCDEGGQIYDFVGSYDDVLARRVRFIGTAEHRIEEDYLRILRFFRFSALYAKGALDAEGMVACIAKKDGLSRLSSERVKQEIFKLLMAPFASVVIEKMVETQVMDKVLPGSVNVRCFTALIELERILALPALAPLRLAALASGDAGRLDAWSTSLRLSNRERISLRDLGRHVGTFSSTLDEVGQKALLYKLSEKTYRNCAVLAWALEGKNADFDSWKELISLPQRWPVPKFSLTGADVMAHGVATGPRIGQILSRLEQNWINTGFEWDAAELKTRLKAIVGEI